MQWLLYTLGGFVLGLLTMAYFTVYEFRDRIHTGLRGFMKGSGKPKEDKSETDNA